MTVTEFSTKLSAKFPEYLNPGPGADELKDIGEFLGKFVPEDLERVWSTFREGYTYNTLPKLAAIVKASRECEARFKPGVSRPQPWEYVCYLCTAKFGRTHRYPIDEPTCPTCGNRDRPYFALIRAGGETNLEEAIALVAKYPPGPHPVYGRPHLKGLTNVRRESPVANPSLASSGARLAGVSARSDNQPSPEVSKCATDVAIEEQGGADDIVF